MTTMTDVAAGTHVYRVFIKAAPEQIWEAITSPEWNYRYGYGAVSEYDLRPGGKYRALASAAMKAYDPDAPDVMVDGEVLEVDPPHRLVQTYRFLFSPELIEEGFTRVTYEIKPLDMVPGTSVLTVTHEAPDAPLTATIASGDDENAGGGFPLILSDLKTLLETGVSLSGS
jgi:uncharacterized protein YndB with AHSA1/START domain